MKTINSNDLHAKDMADAAYRLAYESLAGEFELVKALLHARAKTGISQVEVASGMGTIVNTIKGVSAATNRNLER